MHCHEALVNIFQTFLFDLFEDDDWKCQDEKYLAHAFCN